MRAVALVILALLLSGCLADDTTTDGDAEQSSESSFEPFSKTFEFTVPAGAAPAGEYDPARQSWNFDVPAGATDVFIKGTWSCVSFCPLDVTVEDGDGNVRKEGSTGGWSGTFDAVEGTWTLTIASPDGQETTIGSEGEHVVTVS